MVSSELFSSVFGFQMLQERKVPKFNVKLLSLKEIKSPSPEITEITYTHTEKTSPPGKRQLVIVGGNDWANILFFSNESGYHVHSFLQQYANENFPEANFSIHGAIIPVRGHKNINKSGHKLIIYQPIGTKIQQIEHRDTALIEDLLVKLNAQTWSVQRVPFIENGEIWIPPLEVAGA